MYILPPPDTLNPVVEIDIGSNGNVWVAIYWLFGRRRRCLLRWCRLARF